MYTVRFYSWFVLHAYPVPKERNHQTTFLVLRQSMSLQAIIQERIQAGIAGIVSLEVRVVDEGSAKYAVAIVAEQFRGVPLVQRHRAVNELFSEELTSGAIHALEISAKPPPAA